VTRDIYDYVVVGGGSAGSVVASRLAEGGAEVLLLEAGGTDNRPDVRLPVGVPSAYARVNWKYPADPDPTRCGQPEAWMAGKVLGGGGSINSCVFVRGNRLDYDGWAKEGCTGWDYDSVLPAFRRMETWEGGSDDYRGGTGPISVRVQRNRGLANMAYIEACVQAGYPRNADYNAEKQDGVGLAQVNQRRGFRSQSSWEYLRKVAPKGRLSVLTKAVAHRVLLDHGKAVGVRYRRDGAVRQAWVRQEVILSAGSLASPRLLMLSGIGPRDELTGAGVELIHELPGVGQNLHEHPYLMQRWHAHGVQTFNKPRPAAILRDLVAFARDGGGILALTMVQVQCMTRTDPSLPAPDLQMQFNPLAITRGVDENGMFNVQLAKQEGFLASCTFLKPRARGSIGLRSSSPEDPPRISYRFLGDPDDVRDVLRGRRAVQEVMSQPAMREITGDQFQPEARCHSDADWERYVRAQVTPSYHPVGSCRMGIDDMAVVDPELRVHGVRDLRVVDASIMPTITTGNTNAPSMMIGERAVELILSGAG